MEVMVERIGGGVVVVALSGEVDKYTSPEVRKSLLPIFGEKPAALLVDLSRVSYIDSSGIATLAEGLQWSHRTGTAFRLVGMEPSIREVFRLARLEQLFDIFESREDALEGLT